MLCETGVSRPGILVVRDCGKGLKGWLISPHVHACTHKHMHMHMHMHMHTHTHAHAHIYIYRKIPIISAGLILFRKPFLGGLIFGGGAYYRGGGLLSGGAYYRDDICV